MYTHRAHIVFVFILLCFAMIIDCSKKNPTNTLLPGAIKGKVSIAALNVAVVGALVSLVPGSAQVAADTLGNYSFTNITPGDYTVAARKVGYFNGIRTVHVRAGQNVVVNISMIAAIEMVTISAGYFDMGSDSTDPYFIHTEWPKHTIYLDGFQIGKYPVTNAQYQTFMDADGYYTPAYWSTTGWRYRIVANATEPLYWSTGEYNSGMAYPDYPVVGVSWFEAEAFCRWAGGRLPTEAEWEKAARGADHRFYPWGNVWDATKCNSSENAGSDTFTYSSPAGIFTGGASPYGALDMVGNVQEWVNDWFKADYYSGSPLNNPLGPDSAAAKVLRGACFVNSYAYCRCAERNDSHQPYRSSFIGFRLAK
jgi:formylglycine-generating enzyme required for sulfatase activity